MKNYRKNVVGCLICILSIAGCSDYLNVKPRDKYLESQVFSKEAGIKNALNGIYMELVQKNLYGGNLTMSILEIFAQGYDFPSTVASWYQYNIYNYNDADVRATMENIWSDAYKLILNINKFIEGLEASSGVISENKEKLLKGEAYGLRAMLHFDIVRLFGPVYKNKSTALSIPYYEEVSDETHELLPANVVIEKILQDLEMAEELLSEDSIIKQGAHTTFESDGNDFYSSYRNRRMNYYAVIALKARVHLWAGHNDEAYAAATKVINEAQRWFPWVEPGAILNSSNPDRVFSSEVLFGVENRGMYDRYRALFSPNLSSTNILIPLPERLETVYESNINDYRYNAWFKIPNIGEYVTRTFFKYTDVENPAMKFRFFQPLIRLSEIYYIAAETAPNKGQAIEYLNTVRFHRGLTDLPSTANLEDEITKAYQKEFYGEGQLFFYYKRKAFTSIPNGSSPFFNIQMGAEKYVIPLPESETNF